MRRGKLKTRTYFAPGRSYRSSGPRQGARRTSRARPGLDQALAAAREGDTLTVTKLDRLARSVPDALDVLNHLSARGVRFALGGSVYDWNDPFARMFLQILAVIAEFEANLIRQRTRDGMEIARQNGKLRGKQSRLKPAQDREIRRMHDSSDYNVAEIAALFSVSRPTVYRSLDRTAELPPLPADTRPIPDVTKYDQLLTRNLEQSDGPGPSPQEHLVAPWAYLGWTEGDSGQHPRHHLTSAPDRVRQSCLHGH